MNARKFFTEIICVLLVVLFLYAAFSKLLDYHNFYIRLGRSPFIYQFAGLIAWAIPLTEIITAGLLISNKTRTAGLISSLILMFSFTLYVSLVLGAAKKVPCTCGGLLQSMSWQQHLTFNVFTTILILLTLFLQRNSTEPGTIHNLPLSSSH
ncbi:hypothetical protein MUY27_00155 [Mucilaginibacter sp. RS28]|uniref:Methylamine utilisation protein MauE domain-containing protein n=1 Tax=Mucilaginibacter straminoryzae TaxID=2932774 RepID=A0A9X2B799_9SPHI|nr:MauE/DoxX family redox-associated membrane protein [Mucilaginibacter straminoryzae]MCJ8208096.1 hypothetical protein [Mucilaginibacter straminoryzae]